ncbi:hypothetical protein SAMN04487943_102253 [Gracilibacillus orientalis]|uniref:YtkA-like n=1 Tax=Gracilibacillus orientalis TaxID=334253 RepID=A0A1I4ISJ8_9BACI|nr:hypothetical protein [Gracilibacillus orientalis]SFL56821.1 hypothetical protein SAMN04487943_102253 [Gracilibacillus orientalis]
MKNILLMIILLILLVACSPNQVNEEAINQYKTERPVEISLDLPNELKTNEDTMIEIHVSRSDVKEITASLRKHGETNNSINLDVTKKKNTYYLAQHVFQEAGIYYLQITVDTRDSNIMPTKRLIVGNLNEEEQKILEQENDHTNHDEHDHSDHH